MLNQAVGDEWSPGRRRCPKQDKKVKAHKSMTIETAPNILTIHLKRFEFGGYGHKISRHVAFGTELDIGPYLSKRPSAGSSTVYDLYGVVVHAGHSIHSGHYYAYVKAGNGIWYRCDDEHVSQTSEQRVLEQKAYLLFYIRRGVQQALTGHLEKALANGITNGASGIVQTPGLLP